VSDHNRIGDQALLHAIVDASDDAIVAGDLNGIVTLWNTGADKLFGYSRAEILGRSIDLLVPEDRRAEDRTVMARALAGERVDHYETIRLNKAGHRVEVSLTVSSIRAEDEVVGFSQITRDVTDRKIADRQAFHLAALVDSSDDAIISKDLDGVVQTWNVAAERMFGYTAAEMIGRSITTIIPDDRLPEEAEVLARIRRGQKIEHYETIRRAKNGTAIPISLTVSPIRDRRGTVVGASKIARDLTPLRKYANTLEQTVNERTAALESERDALEREREALRMAEEALRVKDEFLATLSHELRTPLNAISGWLQIIKSIPEPDRIARGLTAIERNTAALQRLIEDLVDASRMVTGQVVLQIQPTDAREVIEAALDAVRPTAHAKEITIDVTAPPELQSIAGDPDRLQQIVWNLLSNAVKFTPAGGRVAVGLSADATTIELSVADTGPGIRPDFLARVFEPFAQQDTSTTRAHGGLGLGLAIVRHLVTLHGGTVTVDSTEGHGTIFTVRFPVATAIARGRDELAAAGRKQGKRLDGVHALLVDDDPDAREMIQQILEDEGAVVTAVASVSAAFKALKAHRPQVLVCDVGTTQEDSLAFIRRVRAESRSDIASVPAVAMTALGRDHDRLRALEAGFQFHLPKPVSAIQLLDTVSFLANRKAQPSR
jgi:hypothetical protein